MTKEFNLSEKIIDDEPHESIYTEDIKEFIRLLNKFKNEDVIIIPVFEFEKLIGDKLK